MRPPAPLRRSAPDRPWLPSWPGLPQRLRISPTLATVMVGLVSGSALVSGLALLGSSLDVAKQNTAHRLRDVTALVAARLDADLLATIRTPAQQGEAERSFTSDRYGTYISGFLPLRRRDGSFDAVLGVDISPTEVARERFHTGFGLDRGEVLVGNMGAPDRVNFAIVGDRVNLCSRLEHENRRLGTGIPATRALEEALGGAADDHLIASLGEVSLRGISQEVEIFEIRSWRLQARKTEPPGEGETAAG